MKIFLILFLFLAAGHALAMDITNITAPGSSGTGAQNLANWMTSFYSFSLIAGVFLAVGAIVWAGLKYTLAAGNPSTQSDARDQILQALLGLALLFGAYLILYTINPGLTNIAPPTLNSVSGPGLPVSSTSTDVTLSPAIQAETNPSLDIKFAETYDHNLTYLQNMNNIKTRCNQATAGSGYIIPKTVPGSSDIVFMCAVQK